MTFCRRLGSTESKFVMFPLKIPDIFLIRANVKIRLSVMSVPRDENSLSGVSIYGYMDNPGSSMRRLQGDAFV